MKTATNVMQILVRVTGTIQIILGVVIWFGVADSYIPIHIVSGIILVLSVWALAFIAVRSGVNLAFAALCFAWGLAAVILGITQEHIIPDEGHWIIQIIHLLVGLALLGLGQRLVVLIKQRQRPAVILSDTQANGRTT